MIITISGDLGSGKSTVAKLLSSKLGFERHYAGQIWRDMATERGISLQELHERGEQDPSIDREVDQRTIDFGKKDEDMVFDSHLAWHFIPHSFKVYLDVDPHEAAKRVFADQEHNKARNESETYFSVDTAFEGLKKRKQTNAKRWSEIYGVNIDDPKNYDLVVDTTHQTPEQVAEEIIKHLPPQK